MSEVNKVAARIRIDLHGPEICYVWDNGAERDSTCRVLRAGAHYYLHRGAWPGTGSEVEVYVIPASVAIEMRRLATREAERGGAR